MLRSLLLQIPTVFGRLVYLSSLRDRETHRYAHPLMARILSADDADRTICHSHHLVFTQWIASSLAEQKADLDEYLRSAGQEWALLDVYADPIPPTARDVERQLYITDLETLLNLIRCEPTGASSIPEA